jgi:hypothetical protein
MCSNRSLTVAARFVLGASLALAQAPAPSGPIMSYTATTENVAGAPESIRIDLMRWSTADESDQLLSAWNLTAPTAGAGGRGGRGGRGRAAAAVPDPAPDPSAVDGDAPPAAARGGGRGGRGGRGARGGGGAAAPEAPPLTPEGSLATALGKAPIVGRLWSSEVAGYSLRSAVRLAEPDGGERIVLITDRRLGAWNELWKPAAAGPAANYEFSVIELRLNAKGEGSGKVSLTGKVAADAAAKTVALEDYDVLPVVLKNVKRVNPK